MPGVEAMIAEAEKSLGLREPNHIQTWYCGRNGICGNFAWCNAAITYWAHKSGNYNEVCHGKDYAYTVWHAQRFQSAGEWHTDIAGIKRGDIVFFDWAGSNSVGAIDHIGIVTDVKGGTVYTIEGNTENVCARRVRYASTIVGYGRPKYKGTAPKPPTQNVKTVTVKEGNHLWGVAMQHRVTVAQLREWNDLKSDILTPGQVLKLEDPGTGGTYTPPAFPSGLAPGRQNPSAKGLQRALKAAGYMPESVTLADNYGPSTQAAVGRFHIANPEFAAFHGDPAIGPRGWAHLHLEAYGN